MGASRSQREPRRDGCNKNGGAPKAFEGNVADPLTLRSQVEKLRERYGLRRVVLVGDRGMLTAATARRKNRLVGKAAIALRVGKVIDRHKMGKHFILEIGDDQFSYSRDAAKIAEEAALDGLYVIRTTFLQMHGIEYGAKRMWG